MYYLVDLHRYADYFKFWLFAIHRYSDYDRFFLRVYIEPEQLLCILQILSFLIFGLGILYVIFVPSIFHRMRNEP